MGREESCGGRYFFRILRIKTKNYFLIFLFVICWIFFVNSEFNEIYILNVKFSGGGNNNY